MIEQVSLKNFMCHSSLTIKFCPQVNFIIGQNGSKSSLCMLTTYSCDLNSYAGIVVCMFELCGNKDLLTKETIACSL